MCEPSGIFHCRAIRSSAPGCGLGGTSSSLLIAGSNAGSPDSTLSLRCSSRTVTAEFRVTSAVGIPCLRSHRSIGAAPFSSSIVAAASASIFSMISFAVAACAGDMLRTSARMSLERSTPHRLYMRPKSMLGTVRVPSMSKTTPRSIGRAIPRTICAEYGLVSSSAVRC
eukprot:2835234-Pleurochrysis_carterae.AAC.1